MLRIVGMGCLWEAEETLKGTLAARSVRKGGLVTSEMGYMTGAPLSNGDVGNADEDLNQTWIHETLTRHTGFEDMEFA